MQFTDFYDDIDFMIVLFYNRMLSNADVYGTVNRLNNKTTNDILAKIIANGPDGNNKRLFYNYLDAHRIKLFDSKRAVAAKVFYYILHNKIDFYKGIWFVHRNVSDNKNITEYIGDDIGIDQILGKYYAIVDADITDKKDIEAFKKQIQKEMRQYIKDNLVEFPVGNVKKNSGNTKAER
jgi:hypothetical protein